MPRGTEGEGGQAGGVVPRGVGGGVASAGVVTRGVGEVGEEA